MHRRARLGLTIVVLLAWAGGAAAAPFLTGVVEGYYGRPWTGEARREVIGFLGRYDMNTFVYGPKNDTYHRDQWRVPYPQTELDDLAATAKHARQAGVQFVYALSPALDICYACAEDTRALRRKLRQLVRARVKRFALFFDDAPTTLSHPEDIARYGSSGSDALARAQAELVRRTSTWLARRTRKRLAFMVPTDYFGTACSPYLDALDDALPRTMPVGWTGTAVVPATVTAEEATLRRGCVGNRPLVLWDNYPVNDAILSSNLHLGPLTGRAGDLGDALGGGHLLNPMTQARASLVALGTAAAYFASPLGYDPEAAWRTALTDLAPAGTLDVLAEQTRSSGLDLDDARPLAAIVDDLEARYAGGDWSHGVSALATETLRQRTAALALGELDLLPLATEVAPWAAEMRDHATEGIQSAELLAAMKPSFDGVQFVSVGGESRLVGHIAYPDEPTANSLGAVLSVPRVPPTFGELQTCLGPLLTPEIGFCPELGLNVHGKELYLVLGNPLALVTGRNQHERLMAFVAAAYLDWAERQMPVDTITLAIDGVDTPLTPSNDFDVPAAPEGPIRLVATTEAGDATALVCASSTCGPPE